MIAAHSMADPRAMAEKCFWSAELILPEPSAMFSGIETEARRSW